MLFVTGATGYLGAATVALLVERGVAVRALVRDPARAAVLSDGVERVAADLADETSLRRAMTGCDGVFHLAASLGPDPEDTRRVNVDGTAAVLRAARDAGVRRVVYTSSSAAIVTAAGLLSERASGGTALRDPYSVSKADAERLVLDAAAAGTDAVVVNAVNVYGPSPRGPHSYNGLFAAAARGEVTDIVDAPVGWVLAEDVALGHLLAFERGTSGRRYLLCGEVATFSRVLDSYCALVGSPHRVRARAPGTALGADASLFARRSEVYGRLGAIRVDDTQARELGFRPRGIDEGLRVTAAWMTGF